MPIERVETLPAIERFLKATGDSEIAWLSDGVDTGRGAEFLDGLRKIDRRSHADDFRRRRAAAASRWSRPKMPRRK